MKKTVLLILFSIVCLLFCFASETKTLPMSFDLSSASGDDSWVKMAIGFTNSDPTPSFTGSSAEPETATELILTKSQNENNTFSLIGEGTTYIYWQILSYDNISAKLSSSILALEDGDGSDKETLNWSTSTWKKKEQTNGVASSSETGSDLLSLNADNGYGTNEGVDTTIFIHDGENKALASYGYTQIDITTKDAATKHAGKYTTTLTLTITSEGEGSTVIPPEGE